MEPGVFIEQAHFIANAYLLVSDIACLLNSVSISDDGGGGGGGGGDDDMKFMLANS